MARRKSKYADTLRERGFYQITQVSDRTEVAEALEELVGKPDMVSIPWPDGPHFAHFEINGRPKTSAVDEYEELWEADRYADLTDLGFARVEATPIESQKPEPTRH